MRLVTLLVSMIIVLVAIFVFLNRSQKSIDAIRVQVDSTVAVDAGSGGLGVDYARDAVKTMNKKMQQREKMIESIGEE